MKRLLFFLVALSLLFVSCGKSEEFAGGEEDSQFEGTSSVDHSDWKIGKPGGRFVRSDFGGGITQVQTLVRFHFVGRSLAKKGH